MDLIAEESADIFGVTVSNLSGNSEVLVFLLAQPAKTVGIDKPGSRQLRLVGPTSVNDRPEIKQNRSFCHGRLNQVSFGHVGNLPKVLTARRDACRSVVLREIVKRPHRSNLEFDLRDTRRINVVVSVQRLIFFARMDLYGGAAANPVVSTVRFQYVIGDFRNTRMCDQFL